MAMKRGEGQSPERREPTSKLFSPARTLHDPAQRTTPEQAVAYSGVCNSMDDGTTPAQHAVDIPPYEQGVLTAGLVEVGAEFFHRSQGAGFVLVAPRRAGNPNPAQNSAVSLTQRYTPGNKQNFRHGGE